MTANSSPQNPIIIGLTGSFGSGCSYIADHIFVNKGYRKLSLSDILKDKYKEDHEGKPHSCRNDLQQYGDHLRQEYGAGYLAHLVIEIVDKAGPDHNKWVIDSIRNPEEIYVLRSRYNDFYLFGIFADRETRWGRVKGNYHNDNLSFLTDDDNDSGSASEPYGQRVSDCFYEADIVIANQKQYSAPGNTEFSSLERQIGQYVSLVEKPLSGMQTLRSNEAIMAMAYTVSQRSSCRQRKVGAVITDENGTVISSGFNEVPQKAKPCGDEYKQCYRRKLMDDFSEELNGIVPDKRDEVFACVKKHFRALDKCRALHAEENAIVNLALHGRATAISKCTLYTTTYPCRLCANKISQLGIKHVVYLEPYPDDEAKIILTNNGVIADFFEGITYRAYFRIYGEKK